MHTLFPLNELANDEITLLKIFGETQQFSRISMKPKLRNYKPILSHMKIIFLLVLNRN